MRTEESVLKTYQLAAITLSTDNWYEVTVPNNLPLSHETVCFELSARSGTAEFRVQESKDNGATWGETKTVPVGGLHTIWGRYAPGAKCLRVQRVASATCYVEVTLYYL